MPKDKTLVSVYVPQEAKEKLEAWAEEEDRSVSYIVGRLIAEALEAREKQKHPPTSDTSSKGRVKKGGKQ
jgi:predicted DNA-binding protein